MQEAWKMPCKLGWECLSSNYPYVSFAAHCQIYLQTPSLQLPLLAEITVALWKN